MPNRDSPGILVVDDQPDVRALLQTIGAAGMALATSSAWADQSVELPIAGEPRERPVTHGFPQKGPMILQRTRPPLLETPMEVFDRDVFTPNDQFYVRWHWAVIPTSVDAEAFRLAVETLPNDWRNGASPAQLETEVARKIENSIATLQGIKHIYTKVSDGVAVVTAEFRPGCLFLSSFHTFPAENTVVKTQSLIERRA